MTKRRSAATGDSLRSFANTRSSCSSLPLSVNFNVTALVPLEG